jgi:hypothetical protein
MTKNVTLGERTPGNYRLISLSKTWHRGVEKTWRVVKNVKYSFQHNEDFYFKLKFT